MDPASTTLDLKILIFHGSATDTRDTIKSKHIELRFSLAMTSHLPSESWWAINSCFKEYSIDMSWPLNPSVTYHTRSQHVSYNLFLKSFFHLHRTYQINYVLQRVWNFHKFPGKSNLKVRKYKAREWYKFRKRKPALNQKTTEFNAITKA